MNFAITINSIVVIQFFHITYINIIDYLIAFKKQDDFLRFIFYYYSIIKINNYGIFYLYYMLWLSKNLYIIKLKIKLLDDKNFAT